MRTMTGSRKQEIVHQCGLMNDKDCDNRKDQNKYDKGGWSWGKMVVRDSFTIGKDFSLIPGSRI